MSDKAQSRRNFLANTSAITAAVALPAAVVGCSEEDNQPSVEVNPEWEEIADGLEQSKQCCWTGDEDPAPPNRPTVGAHLPEIEFEEVDGRVRASVFTLGDEAGNGQLAPHPMLREHWITTMYVRNQDGIVISLRDFGEAAIKQQFINSDPRFEFDVPAGTRWLRAYAFCNLHQHWRGHRFDIET
jgi:desulfoferrodoxin (superoxide reductase-like protein)